MTFIETLDNDGILVLANLDNFLGRYASILSNIFLFLVLTHKCEIDDHSVGYSAG